MKTENAEAFYFDYAEKLNDRLRTLAMTGIGIIWVFKQCTETGAWMPQTLLRPGFLLVAGLALDVLQQAYGMIAWGAVAKKFKNKPSGDFEVPNWLNWPTKTMLYLRILLTIGGYILLLTYLRSRFLPS